MLCKFSIHLGIINCPIVWYHILQCLILSALLYKLGCMCMPFGPGRGHTWGPWINHRQIHAHNLFCINWPTLSWTHHIYDLWIYTEICIPPPFWTNERKLFYDVIMPLNDCELLGYYNLSIMTVWFWPNFRGLMCPEVKVIGQTAYKIWEK